jgi:CheY-like chemotaxis protein
MTRSMRAVVVEDNSQMRALIHTVLGSIGFKEIIEAANGEEAIMQIGRSRAQLVIMDWKMDVMDGLECTRRIRAGTDGIDPKLPIILLTGMTGSDSERAAYEAGADLFMEKPFSIKKLHAGIEKIIGAT